MDSKKLIIIIALDQHYLKSVCISTYDHQRASSILAHHLEDCLFGLLGTGSVQVVTTTLDKGQSRFDRGSEQLDLLFRNGNREHRILRTLQPVHRALDIEEAADQTISLHEVDERHKELLPPLVATVDLLDGLVPERQDVLTDCTREAQASDHATPYFVNDKLGVGNRPLLQEWREVDPGVPSAQFARARRLVVHGCSQRKHAEDLPEW